MTTGQEREKFTFRLLVNKMKILNTRTIYKSNWSSYIEKKYLNTNNREKTWEYIERNKKTEAAVIIPVDINNNKIVLIKQFRVPLEKYIIEFPAGLIDPGETPGQTAKRELLEETGFDITKIISVSPGLCTSPGLTNEIVYIIEAEIDSSKQQSQNTEGSEDIEVIIVDINNLESELIRLNNKGHVIDAKIWTYAGKMK